MQGILTDHHARFRPARKKSSTVPRLLDSIVLKEIKPKKKKAKQKQTKNQGIQDTKLLQRHKSLKRFTTGLISVADIPNPFSLSFFLGIEAPTS